MVRNVNTRMLTENIKEMCIQANHYLAPDMEKAMRSAYEKESKPLAKQILGQLLENLDIAGEKGGLMVAPTHLLEPEVPWANILAYAEACREYKKK